MEDLEPDDLMAMHESRSEIARETDEALRAEVTNDEEQWASAPDEYDFPGVDTPSAEADEAIMEFNEGGIGLSELADRL